jgi:hypothetical protein
VQGTELSLAREQVAYFERAVKLWPPQPEPYYGRRDSQGKVLGCLPTDH